MRNFGGRRAHLGAARERRPFRRRQPACSDMLFAPGVTDPLNRRTGSRDGAASLLVGLAALEREQQDRCYGGLRQVLRGTARLKSPPPRNAWGRG